jgi:glycosyltransferase involved in cell wall biosynthesis
MIKLVLITGMLPSGHYSQYLANGLNELSSIINLKVYADQAPENLIIKNCGQIKCVWEKSPNYILQILRELLKDRPDIVHLQHEMNMYGGIITAALFPVLLVFLRLLGFRLIVTIHAAVWKYQIDNEFVNLFLKKNFFLSKIFLKLYFNVVFFFIRVLAARVIVHTELAKEILIKDYRYKAQYIDVIPISIPEINVLSREPKDYFFYFGYMVRRKGLGFALEGFSRFLKKNPSSSCKLVLAGGIIPGQEFAYEELLALIVRLNLKEKVEIRGYIETQEELRDLYGGAICTIIPAIVSMGSSGPLFHATSHHQFVIATKVGHFIEDIDHLKTGFLVENHKWDEAFEFVLNNQLAVAEIKKEVAKKAFSRNPAKIGEMHRQSYEKVVGICRAV